MEGLISLQANQAMSLSTSTTRVGREVQLPSHPSTQETDTECIVGSQKERVGQEVVGESLRYRRYARRGEAAVRRYREGRGSKSVKSCFECVGV